MVNTFPFVHEIYSILFVATITHGYHTPKFYPIKSIGVLRDVETTSPTFVSQNSDFVGAGVPDRPRVETKHIFVTLVATITHGYHTPKFYPIKSIGVLRDVETPSPTFVSQNSDFVGAGVPVRLASRGRNKIKPIE